MSIDVVLNSQVLVFIEPDAAAEKPTVEPERECEGERKVLAAQLVSLEEHLRCLNPVVRAGEHIHEAVFDVADHGSVTLSFDLLVPEGFLALARDRQACSYGSSSYRRSVPPVSCTFPHSRLSAFSVRAAAGRICNC